MQQGRWPLRRRQGQDTTAPRAANPERTLPRPSLILRPITALPEESLWICDADVSRGRPICVSQRAPLFSISLPSIAMDQLAVRRGAPNGLVRAEGTMMETRRRKKVELVQEAIHGLLEERRRDRRAEKGSPAVGQQQQLEDEEEESLLSSLLTKVDALEKGGDSDDGVEPNSSHPNPEQNRHSSKDVELADIIAKDLNRIKRQNTITHVLLGAVIVMTAVWQFNEVSFLLWVQEKLSNPFKSVGDMIKSSLKLRGARSRPVIEGAPLPPVGVPDIHRNDLPILVIGSTRD